MKIIKIIVAIVNLCIAALLLLYSIKILLYPPHYHDVVDISHSFDSLTIQTYNEGYTLYVGNRVRGSTVKQLTNKIEAHNENEDEIDLYGAIEIVYNDENDCNKIIKLIKNKYYMVEIVEYHESGTISKIVIRDYETESGNTI